MCHSGSYWFLITTIYFNEWKFLEVSVPYARYECTVMRASFSCK